MSVTPVYAPSPAIGPAPRAEPRSPLDDYARATAAIDARKSKAACAPGTGTVIDVTA